MEEEEKFIKGLENEHAMIETAFKKLEPVIIEADNISDFAYVLNILEQLKTMLTNHIRSEDDKFYPDMRQKAVELKQDALLPALDIFIRNMKSISKMVFDFFSKYKNENDISSDKKEFVKGLAEIRDVLIKRINSEEKTLYYIYKAYHNL